MTNVEMTVEGDTLTIKIDLTQRNGRSASGKTIMVGSTGGNQKVQHNGTDVFVGVNAYVK